MNTKRFSNWFSSKNKSHRRTLAIEPLEHRQMLSVTSIIDNDVAFHTTDQSMWDSGQAASITASFSQSLLDVDFDPISIGGYASFFGAGKTGMKASFAGGFDLGVSGDFEVNGGAVDVDYQTDITVSASRVYGGDITDSDPLTFGEHFILRAEESPDVEAIAMQTEFVNISASLDLDYGLEVHASLTGKIAGSTVFNKGFDKVIDDSVEIIGAELNPGTGVGVLWLLGGDDNTPFGKTYGIDEDNPSLDFEVALGIVNVAMYVPTLNTGVADDDYDDSTVSGSRIVNSQLPVDRGEGQTRIDFFKLAIGLDNIVSAITRVPLAYDVGNSTVGLEVTLIDADVEAYLGLAQTMTFDANVMVEYEFSIDGEPTLVAVETAPGSGRFESVTSKLISVGQDLEIVHPGGELEIDTNYVLGGQFSNSTDVYLSPAFALTVGKIELTGSLVETAQDLGLLPDDLSLCLYCPDTIPLGDPIPIVNLFDESFDLGGFSEVDGGELSLESVPPTTYTLIALAVDPTVTEGEPLVVNGNVYDPDRLADGSDVYGLVIEWNGFRDRDVFLLDDDPSTPMPSYVNYDPLSGAFTIAHTYADQVGSQNVTLKLDKLTQESEGITQSTTAQIGVEIVNAAPTVSLDPLFLNNDGDATLSGSFQDVGVDDEHSMFIEWHDEAFSRFTDLPNAKDLSVGDKFSAPTVLGNPFIVSAELTVESVDAVTGMVEFTVTGYTYPANTSGTLVVTVNDLEGGEAEDSVRVPWGFNLSTIFTTSISENSRASVTISFNDVSSSNIPVQQTYDLVVDWDDPNDPRLSTFRVTGNILDQFEVDKTFHSSTDDSVLRVVNVDLDLKEPGGGLSVYEWDFTPTFTLERQYADDGDAEAGNNRNSDISTVVVNIFEEDGLRGGTVIVPITVTNVAPKLTLEPTEEVNAGGVALLSGTIRDPGRLDAFELHVAWGDGANQVFTFDPSAAGTQDFTVSHVYTEDLDGGGQSITATVYDDDGDSDFANTQFVVDFDLAPVAHDDYVSTNSNQILLIDVLADNDLDNTSDDPDPCEDFDRRDVDPEGRLFDAAGNFWVSPKLVKDSANSISAAVSLISIVGGTITFDPRIGYADLPVGEKATAIFDYQIEDAAGQTDTATVTITVIGVGVNNAPTAGVLSCVVAYANDADNVGTQSFGGALGHDFLVDRTIDVTQLGVFDSGSDGLNRTITAQLWTRDGNTGTQLAELVFTPEEPGTLVGGDRFKPLDEALTLPPGEYTIVAFGYGADEPNGNQATGGPLAAAKTTADAEGAIEFVGSSRFGLVAGEFPDTPDSGPASRYSAGTFRFDVPRSANFAEVTHEDAGIVRLDVLAASGITDADAADVLSLSSLEKTSGRDIDFSQDGNLLVFDTNQFNDLEIGQSETLRFDFAISDDSGEANDTITGVLTITVEGRDEAPNFAPTISSDVAEIVVDESETASNSGTFDDADAADNVTITASLGTVTQDAGNSGVWTWSFDTSDGPDESQPVTITATDSAGASSTTAFDLVVNNLPPSIRVREHNVVIDEGDTARATIFAGDRGNDEVTVSASIGTLEFDGSNWDWSLDTSVEPAESQTVTITVTDSDGAQTTAEFPLWVNSTQDVPADLTGNGFVDFEDLTVLLANWNQNVSAAEGNLVDAATTPVNFEDLTVLLAGWTGPGPAGAPGPQAVAATGSRVASVSTQETTTAEGRLTISDHFDRLGRRDDLRSRSAGRRTERSISPDDSLRRLQAAAVDHAMSEESNAEGRKLGNNSSSS